MPRGTLGVSRKKSSARCVNMDFSKLMSFFCLTYATHFAGKEGLLVISDFPVHHFKMPIKTASCAGQRICGNSNLSISASEAFDSQSRVKPSPAVSDNPSEYAFCLTKYRKS